MRDSFRAGKQEMKLGIKPAAETVGLTLESLGRQVRQAFYGEEASASSGAATSAVRESARDSDSLVAPSLVFRLEGVRSWPTAIESPQEAT